MFPQRSSHFRAFYTNDPAPKTDPGVQIVPGTNSFPAYTQIMAGASVLKDCYGILINFNSGMFSAEIRDMLISIGVDPAGGTNYTTIIPNLLASDAGGFATAGTGGGGHWYYFPIFIKAGSSIAAQASVNNATVRTVNVLIQLYADPSEPRLLRVGSYVEAIGIVQATSRGTAVVAGINGADGSWTLLGTTVKDLWYWEMSMGIADASIANAWFCADLGVGSVGTNEIIIFRERLLSTSAEAINKMTPSIQPYRDVQAGSGIVARLANSAAVNETTVSIAAYGVGG